MKCNKNWLKTGSQSFELCHNETIVASLQLINSNKWLIYSQFGFSYEIKNYESISTVLHYAEMIIATNIFLKCCYYTSLNLAFVTPTEESLYWLETELGYELRYYNDEIKETSMIACVQMANHYVTYSSVALGVCNTVIFNDDLDYVEPLVMQKLDKCCKVKSLLLGNIYLNCFSEEIRSRLLNILA